MVTITNYYEVERKDGTKFISLELTGGAELIQSTTTGSWYATVRKARIPSTFDARVAQSMIGQKIEGDIVKSLCDPYQYTNPRTGETMTLQHCFSYSADGKLDSLVGHTKVMELESA